jgi:CHAD domain-containing protein
LSEHFADELGEHELDSVRRYLERRREDVESEQPEIHHELEASLRLARERAKSANISDDVWKDIEPGFRRTYRRGRKACRRAFDKPSPGRLHELRKQAKYHYYQLTMLSDAWPEPVRARASELKTLSELLGQDHDLWLLRQSLSRPARRFGSQELARKLRSLIQRRRLEIYPEIRTLGNLIYAERPRAISERFGVYFDAWRRRHSAHPPHLSSFDSQFPDAGD